ncbi:MAG: twin-arginine translocation signal domain-containing protein [Faecalibacterium prausnitzii]
MSLEFNRRSFLKYSAAAAVAVAGSSLLTGCGEDEYQKTGKIGSTLKLMGTFTMYGDTKAPTYTAPSNSGSPTYGSAVFNLSIKCTTKKVPLCVNDGCFELTVTHSDGETNYAGSSHIKVDSPILDLSESDGAQDFTITVNGTAGRKLTIADGEKVEFKYWPRIQASSGNSGYTRAFCTWKMTARNNSGTIVLE